MAIVSLVKGAMSLLRPLGSYYIGRAKLIDGAVD
jgi:hypothetical protein